MCWFSRSRFTTSGNILSPSMTTNSIHTRFRRAKLLRQNRGCVVILGKSVYCKYQLCYIFYLCFRVLYPSIYIGSTFRCGTELQSNKPFAYSNTFTYEMYFRIRLYDFCHKVSLSPTWKSIPTNIIGNHY